jgi:hypothetical protein
LQKFNADEFVDALFDIKVEADDEAEVEPEISEATEEVEKVIASEENVSEENVSDENVSDENVFVEDDSDEVASDNAVEAQSEETQPEKDNYFNWGDEEEEPVEEPKKKKWQFWK